MTITITDINGTGIAELISDIIEINNAQDAVELLANAGYQGAQNVIIHQKNITPDFFDLKTGIAGEILQKFSTYQVKLAIVGDFSAYRSKSLKDFMYESNKAGRISFVHSISEAKISLLKK